MSFSFHLQEEKVCNPERASKNFIAMLTTYASKKGYLSTLWGRTKGKINIPQQPSVGKIKKIGTCTHGQTTTIPSHQHQSQRQVL